jgi:hypothetical protein
MRRFRRAAAPAGPATRGPAARGPATRGPATRGPATRGPVARGLLARVLMAAGLVAAGVMIVCAVPAGAASAADLAGPVASADPASAAPGAAVTITASCGNATASATLLGQPLGLAAQIAMDAGTAPGQFSTSVTLPDSIRLGTYHPQVSCSDGTSAQATLRVTEVTAADVRTGSGAGSSAANTGLMVGGLVLIAIGAIAGGIAIRRRASERSRSA